MDRLTPTRTVTATRLITVTTTYETELTENEFLALTPLENRIIRLLDVADPMNLETLAVEILSNHGDDFTAIAQDDDRSDDLQAILAILNGFEYDQFGKIMLSEYNEATDGYSILDGNYRSVALALLLKSKQVEYQPVTAMHTVIEQSVSEPIGSDTISQTKEHAQEGMRHYPVTRK